MSIFAAVVAFSMTFTQAAEPEGFRRGEVLSHRLSVCFDKETAEGVAVADRDGGSVAGQRAFLASSGRCRSVEVADGSTVGRAVFSAPTTRGTGTLRVVEIVSVDGDVVAYFFTTLPYEARAVGERPA